MTRNRNFIPDFRIGNLMIIDFDELSMILPATHLGVFNDRTFR